MKQRKIKLIHDYKQFKFDISEIQNELESPDVITPLDFPELVVDESIDVRNIRVLKYLSIYHLNLFIYVHKISLSCSSLIFFKLFVMVIYLVLTLQ